MRLEQFRELQPGAFVVRTGDKKIGEPVILRLPVTFRHGRPVIAEKAVDPRDEALSLVQSEVRLAEELAADIGLADRIRIIDPDEKTRMAELP